MKSTSKIHAAALAVAVAILAGQPASAADLNPRSSTPNLQYGDVLKIRLPYGLCEFEQVVPAYVVDKLSQRNDWNRLVEYMLTNCPDLGLPLADTATASISEFEVDESGSGTGGTGGTGGEGTGGEGGTDGDTDGDTDTSDDDGNNGHGNDTDGHDESNPGNG